MSRLYVFGLGSPHGWDEIGWLAADRLRAQFAGNPSIVIEPLNQPTNLFLHPLSRRDTLIFLDVMLGGGEPGMVRVMTPGDLPNRIFPPSSHGIDLHATLQLLDAVLEEVRPNRPRPSTITIIAIEIPHDPNPGAPFVSAKVLAPWVTALAEAAETQILDWQLSGHRAAFRSSNTHVS